MEKTHGLISLVRPWVSYFAPLVLLVFVGTFMTYLPAIQAASDDLYEIYLSKGLLISLLLCLFVPFFSSLAVHKIIHSIYIPNMRKVPNIWAYMPYLFGVGILSLLFLTVPYLPADLGYVGSYPVDPALHGLHQLIDLRYFLAVTFLVFLLLLFHKALYKHFYGIFLWSYPAHADDDVLNCDRQSTSKSSDSDEAKHNEEFVDMAEKMANTFADPSPAKNMGSVEVDFFSFIYGEGFDYVIINEGYTVPFMTEDGEEIDDMYEGLFAHINKTLYIRLDHIMLINLEDLIVGISPQLEDIYNKVNNKRVKEKIASYRYKPDSGSLFKIDPMLVAKLEKKINRFTK